MHEGMILIFLLIILGLFYNIESKKELKIDKNKKELKIDKKELSMKWYKIMTYGMMPLFLLICILTLKAWGGFFTGVVLILTTISIIGLHQKSGWAPVVFTIFIFTSFLLIIFDYLNFKNSFLNEVGLPTNFMGYQDGAISLIIITWIIWSVPNYIYFSKRKHLFVN